MVLTVLKVLKVQSANGAEVPKHGCDAEREADAMFGFGTRADAAV